MAAAAVMEGVAMAAIVTVVEAAAVVEGVAVVQTVLAYEDGDRGPVGEEPHVRERGGRGWRRASSQQMVAACEWDTRVRSAPSPSMK